MYARLWRSLPGGLAVRLLCSVVLAAAVVALLFLQVFPRVEELLPFGNVTVDAPPNGAPAAPSPAPR